MNSEDILVALRRITRAIDRHSKNLEKSAGLTVPQLLVLHVLDESSDLSVSEIAKRVNLSQGTITSVLDRMEAKSLVSRHRNDQDRRKVKISLTDHGRARLEDTPELLQTEFLRRFEDLRPWEQKWLTASVERIADLMDAGHGEASPILQIGEIEDVDTPKQETDRLAP